MRIRNKLLIGSAIPIVILIIQIVVVNYYIRQLQSATTIIGDAQTVIEADFSAVDHVSALKEEIKKLPSVYDEPQDSTHKLESHAKQLAIEIGTILQFQSGELEAEVAFSAVDSTFGRAQQELAKTKLIAQDRTSDLDTLIERAIDSNIAFTALEKSLSTLAVQLRVRLQNAVDIERSVRHRPAKAGLILGAIALVASAILIYFVVDRDISRRLRKLSDNMLAIAGGELSTSVDDLNTRDEISAMSRALLSFRDTAVEVEENNLRQIAVAQQRLIDALESIADGFAFYSKDGKLELCNRQYGSYLGLQHQPSSGHTYASLISDSIERGALVTGSESSQAVIDRLLGNHHEPSHPHVQQLRDGRWMRISDRLTDTGSRVSLFTDVTDLKDIELRLRYSTGQLLDSIQYASRIQRAVLPDPAELSLLTRDNFLIWEPRDLVGGDFYWFQPVRNGYMIFLGDCTGHGVPGAFMTLISGIILERLLVDDGEFSPATMLEALDDSICRVLATSAKTSAVNDGLEAGICFINTVSQQLVFSGGRFSVWVSSQGEVTEHKGVRRTLGSKTRAGNTRKPVPFVDLPLALAQVGRVFMTTDGLLDQVGGEKRLAFGKRRFRSLLKQQQHLSLAEQASALQQRFVQYQGEEPRRDDVCVLGFDPRAPLDKPRRQAVLTES